MQQDWLKKFNNFKTSGGALPQEPQHPNNIPSNQIQAIYSRLMEHVMFRWVRYTVKGLEYYKIKTTVDLYQ